MNRVKSQRWRRVFMLRRAFTESILLAGMKADKPWVSLPDSLDDTIFAALTKEAVLAERRRPARRRGTR